MIDEYLKELLKKFNEQRENEIKDIMYKHGTKYKEELARREYDRFYRDKEFNNLRRTFTEITSLKWRAWFSVWAWEKIIRSITKRGWTWG